MAALNDGVMDRTDFADGDARPINGGRPLSDSSSAPTAPVSYTLGRRIAARTNHVARKFGVELRRLVKPEQRPFDNWQYYATLLETALDRRRAGACTSLEAAFVDYCLRHHRLSRSQIFQDLFVLALAGEKRNGFFVEFGATDGLSLSNTALLEKDFGWQGILAEPARIWHKALTRNRACTIEPRCVWSKSGDRLTFNEAYSSELSTIDRYTAHDSHANNRLGRHYTVETISLNDLLRQHGAPRVIDYLSVDTEGAEYAILSHFDFSAFEIGIVTVEHNYVAPEREQIHQLMRDNGYERVLADYSLFDDWYVRSRLLAGDQRSP